MKITFHPKPSREDLYTRPLHVIGRDFPETLAEFRAHGVSLEEFGDRTLEEFEDDLHRHVHIENHVLFPKALALEGRQPVEA